ncbi:hypothetical protein [Streptomyces sp. NPDC006324]|uniref:hypothetical protein n=1 Tax=Streptomyces sp. NPDC006324 TaxID=3156751 RepID=UPI0033B3FA68
MGEEGVAADVVALAAVGRGLGGGAAAGVGQGGPVVLTDGVGLDDQVVVAGLGVVADLEVQTGLRGGRDAGEVDGPGEPGPGVVGVLDGREGGALGGLEGGADARVVAGGGAARELREVLRLERVGGDGVRAGVVQRVAGGRAESGPYASEGARAGEGGRVLQTGPVVGAEVVLGEVVGLGGADPGGSAGPPRR